MRSDREDSKMNIPDAQAALENESRAHPRAPAGKEESAGALPLRTDAVEVIYDKVDRRLMDTFPASDAVAQY
jgi:hypothetical protein